MTGREFAFGSDVISEEALPLLVRTGRIEAATPLRLRDGALDEDARALAPRLFAVPPPYVGPAPEDGIWSDRPPRPWRRFAARLIDTSMIGGTIATALWLFLPEVVPIDASDLKHYRETYTGELADEILTVLLTIPANVASTALFGNTIGKRLLGVRVQLDGRRLTLRTVLARECRIALDGQALGMSLLTFVANLAAYWRLGRAGSTLWDEELGVTVRCRVITAGFVGRRICLALGVGLLFAAISLT